MRRATGALLLLALEVGATASASPNAIPPGFSVAARSELSTGVEYLKLTTGTPVVAHVAHVVPGAWVDLKVIDAGDKLSSTPADLETTSSMCGRVHCIVGVNGDFHDNGVPVGGVITGGRMLRSPDPARPQLTVSKDGQLSAGPLPWTGSLTFADGTQIPLGAVNADPPPGGLTVYTPDDGVATPASNRTELIAGAPAGPVGVLGQPAGLVLRGIRTGAGPIPPDGVVLSGDGAAGQQLASAWTRSQANKMAPRARLVVSSPVNAAASLGAYPVVLRNGRKATPYGNDANLIYPQQPHTLVAWNKAGDVFLVAVDGRQATSVGMTMDEAADFLLGLGATDAVNLDGGGGTTFVEGATVVNRPSDNDPARPADYVQRGATNALVVTARPGSPPTTTTNPGAIRPLSVTPVLGSEVRVSSPAPGGSAAPSPTGADGDLIDGPLSGDAGGVNPANPAGPSPADPTASAASATAGAPTLQPSAAAPAQGEKAMAAPARKPDTGPGSEAHTTVTEVLRAPLSAVTSVTGDVVDAAIGGHSHGHQSKGREAGAGLAGALALTIVVARRKRRRRVRPAVERTAGPDAAPEQRDAEPASAVTEIPSAEAAPAPVNAGVDVVSEPVEATLPEPELDAAEPEARRADLAPAGPVSLLLQPFEADVARLLRQVGARPALEATAAELAMAAADVAAQPPGPVVFREVPSLSELRMPIDAPGLRTASIGSVRSRQACRRLPRGR